MERRSKLSGGRQNAIAGSRTREPQQVKTYSFPPPPVMPDAWQSLQLLLSTQVADLRAIADVIRSDVGLMIELLRLPSIMESPQRAGELLDIENLVVLAGIDQLRALAATTCVLPRELDTDVRLRSFEHYSLLAQRAAAIAEQLALNQGGARPEDAHAAALVRHLGALPSILGWDLAEFQQANYGEIGHAVAVLWGLPNSLIDVVRGDREACTAYSRALLDLANTAHAHALAREAASESRPNLSFAAEARAERSTSTWSTQMSHRLERAPARHLPSGVS